jgi:hypothetical protein
LIEQLSFPRHYWRRKDHVTSIKHQAEFQYSLAKNELNEELWFDFAFKARKYGYEL